MELDEVLEPFLINFRRIFFRKTEQGEERLSIVKLALVGAYLFANLFAFLQFSTVTEPVLQVRSQFQDEVVSSSQDERKVIDYQIPMTIYGKLAHYLNFLVLIGALFFIITQDKPLSLLARQLREYTSQSRLHLIGLLLGVGMVSMLTLVGLWSYGLSSIVMDVSYGMGTGMNYLWWVLQPVLFLGGSLLLVNTYMQIDESFRERFGDLTSPTKKTAILVVVDLFIILIFFVIAATVFQVTLDTGEHLGVITRVAGIGWYEITIFWLLIHFMVLITFTIFNMLVLFVVYVLKQSRAYAALILCILFVGLVLLVLNVRQSLPPTLDAMEARFIISVLFLVIFIVFFLLVTFIFVIYKLKISREYLNSRAALIPWILFAGMFLTVLKVAPAILALEGRIKSLYYWLDALGLFFTLFLGLVRVTTVSEHPEFERRVDSSNPLNWVKRIRIPAYSKALFLFYLAFIGFYLTLETHTVSVMLDIQNDFRILRLQILAFTSSFGFMWVFWRYKPLNKITQPPDLTNQIMD